MLDERFKQLATDQISLAFADQDAQNDLDVAAKNTELSNRNMIYASWSARSVGELFGQEIRSRGDIALEKVKRVASTLKIPATNGFETELTAFMEDLLRSEVVKLREKLNNQPTLRGKAGQVATPSYVKMGNEAFDEAVGHMFKKLHSEIALFAAGITDSTVIVEETHTPMGVHRSTMIGLPPDSEPEPVRATGATNEPKSTDRWSAKSNIVAILCTVAVIIVTVLVAIYFGA